MASKEQPYFQQKATRERKELARRDEAIQKAQQTSPERPFRNLSFQEQLEAIYGQEQPSTILPNGTRPATPAEIARIIKNRDQL